MLVGESNPLIADDGRAARCSWWRWRVDRRLLYWRWAMICGGGEEESADGFDGHDNQTGRKVHGVIHGDGVRYR